MEKVREAQKDLDGGLSFDATKATVAQYLNRWLEDGGRPTVRQSAYEGYEYLLGVHIYRRSDWAIIPNSDPE